LQKARQQVQHCEVQLSAERAETVPKVFTKLHLHFVVTGTDVSEKQVERAVKLSAEKYCSVSIMLAQSVKVTHSFSIKQAE
jgi:putative redox protein